MRGRVMAIRLAVALGGTPIGAPIVGWVANRFGPRWALGVGASSGFAAALVAVYVLLRHNQTQERSIRLADSSGGRIPPPKPFDTLRITKEEPNSAQRRLSIFRT